MLTEIQPSLAFPPGAIPHPGIALNRSRSMNTFWGFFYGLLASASYGLIPLFTLPLTDHGLRVDSILFYRFFFACLAIGLVLILRREAIGARLVDLGKLFLLGMFYSMSAIFYFLSFAHMASGIATTIHFLYPVFVAIIMMALFREKKSPITLTAIILAISGVALLSSGGQDRHMSLLGLVLVLISSVANATYIVGMSRAGIRNFSGLKTTFFLLLFGSFFTLIFSLSRGPFQMVDSESILRILLLALITGALSNICLIESIKRIGSTLSSILGALEPVTAVCAGVFVFHEPFTSRIGCGILLILSAVLLIILSPHIAALFLSRKA